MIIKVNDLILEVGCSFEFFINGQHTGKEITVVAVSVQYSVEFLFIVVVKYSVVG